MKKGVDVDKVDLNDYYGCLDSSDDDVGPAPALAAASASRASSKKQGGNRNKKDAKAASRAPPASLDRKPSWGVLASDDFDEELVAGFDYPSPESPLQPPSRSSLDNKPLGKKAKTASKNDARGKQSNESLCNC